MRAIKARLACAPGLPFFLAALAVYAALVPWMGRVWTHSGDEPHYLLAAHSLVRDGDFDLANNYAQRDYESFYTDFYLNPHVRLRPNGQAVLTHNLGLSLLVAPAYALGGLNGVLYFLAGLGALLACNVFLLGYQLTNNWLAAAVGWAAVAFTAPVLWYVFLVYPEMVAGLGFVVALRSLLEERPVRAFGALDALIFGLALAVLPWLSSRFLPAYGLYIAWALWRARAGRSRAWLGAAVLATSGLASYMLFSLWLYGNASPAASYAGPTALGVEGTYAAQRFVRGVAGWLLDNQRGLLISAPVYAMALWGGALLLRRRPAAGLGLLAPFGAALLPVAAWGGFWTGWEYSARFLVAALPPLGACLAYAWAAGRRAVVVPLTTGLLLLSVLVSAVVIDAPLRGIISSPVELLKPRLNLESLVPVMARYAYVPAGTGAGVGAAIDGGVPATAPLRERRDALTWNVPAGESGIALRRVDLPEFPFGWYTGHLPLEATGAQPDTPVVRVKIFSPSGGEYFGQTVYARDLAGGAYNFSFKSPLYNGWGFPPTVLVSTTGQTEVKLGLLSLGPDLYHSLGLAAVWLAGLAVLGWFVLRGASRPRPLMMPAPGAVSGLLAIAAAASLAWSLLPQPRIYALPEVQRTTGRVVQDKQGYSGLAMEASPLAGDEPGKLAATFAEIYSAGHYQITVSATALPGTAAAEPGATAITIRVLAAEVNSVAHHWEVTVGELPADGRYHDFSVDFENSRQQPLTFFVDYPGTVGVRADKVTVTKLP